MPDDRTQQIPGEFKLHQEISNIATILTAIVTIISALSAATGTITIEIGLMIVVPVLVIYLIWMFYTIKSHSIIDWDTFYNLLVIEKFNVELIDSLADSNGYTELYNNYITFVYLKAIYEGKEKFAQELWDKARISDKLDDGKKLKT